MANSDLRFFYGTSHPELGDKITKYLGIKKGEIKISRFAGSEIYVRVLENIRGQSCVIMQTCTGNVNEDLMELFIIIDTMKRASAKSITAVIPHYGYARQDRKAASREPISARLIADLLSTAGVDRVVVVDLHSEQIQGFFNVPVDTLTAMPLLEKYFISKKIPDLAVVAPDTGRAKNAKKMADRLKADLAILHKTRAAHHQSAVTHVVGEVKGKNLLIIDDMIDTGGTMTAGVETLRKEGCKDIYVATTHGLFNGACIEKMEKAGFKEIIATDSVPIPKEKQLKNMVILSTAELLGEAIKRNYENQSITSLFD